MGRFDYPTQLSIRTCFTTTSPLEDDVDYREFQIAGNEFSEEAESPGAEFHIFSQGSLTAYTPPLPCDPNDRDSLQQLPSAYEVTSSERGDQVRFRREVDQIGPLTFTNITEMLLAGVQRVALSPLLSLLGSGRRSDPLGFIRRWPRRVLHSFCLFKHPLAKKQWYKELRSSVFSKIDNCRQSACEGVVLIGVTPTVRNRYTNFELPALMTDLYFAHKDKTTPFFRAGQEMIPLDFAEFRRLSRHDLDIALNEAERARKGIAIVSCCNDYWDEVRETTRGQAEWLAKEITDYRG